jgi:Tfp pilus assembly protein PilN
MTRPVTRRFNLLPAPYVERMVERRWAVFAAAGLGGVLALLVLAGLVQDQAMSRAEHTRDVEQAQTDALTARRGQLAPFRQMADAIAARERVLSAAMATEISWSGVLTSLSSTFPTDASLTSLKIESTLPAFGAPALKRGDDRSIIGSSTLKGYSVKQFTPGVERLLQLLVTVKGLSEPRLAESTVEEIGKRPVTTFEGNLFVNASALSWRYAGGLPPEDRVELPAISASVASTTSATKPSAAGKPTPG